ncbi:MAG TPA: FG-GAP-like repeat-containing protein, partial [Ignavibacteriales bacterium]|nr:FG-GAP-like repeat-containing protein [Ignavibacteriales bacterium]
MKSFSYLPFFVLFFSISIFAQDFQRTVIPVDTTFEVGGYGYILAGYDIDGDGKKEIYAVNSNSVDRPSELIPRIYKYEFNGTSWDSVWGATPDIPLQNTWPAFAIGDLDGDGKMELIWSPVNFLDETTNPNPARVVIYEHLGGDAEYFGVDDGTATGNYLPNVEYTIVTENMANLRPFKFVVSDIDSDGKDELMFCDRAASTGYGMHFAVLSVDKVPDNGDGSETWTIETSGKDNPVLTGTQDKWDIAVLNNYMYLFNITSSSTGANTGKVFPVKYENNVWTVLPAINSVGKNGSFKSASVVDIDNDGTSEIVYGGWFDGQVYLLQPEGDSLVEYKIANLDTLGISRINGGDYGDIDGNGKIDFVFGSRNGADPNNAIGWVKYLGGDITDSNSYAVQLIDSLYYPAGHDMDEVAIADLFDNAAEEVVYSSGYTRGVSDDHPADIVILNYTGSVSVKPITQNAPDNYFLDQNFPNPFNPTTTFRFGLKTESNVDLKIYDILGREVAVLIQNTRMKPGEYDITFDASALASGTYIYKLTAGNVSVS